MVDNITTIVIDVSKMIQNLFGRTVEGLNDIHFVSIFNINRVDHYGTARRTYTMDPCHCATGSVCIMRQLTRGHCACMVHWSDT